MDILFRQILILLLFSLFNVRLVCWLATCTQATRRHRSDCLIILSVVGRLFFDYIPGDILSRILVRERFRPIDSVTTDPNSSSTVRRTQTTRSFGNYAHTLRFNERISGSYVRAAAQRRRTVRHSSPSWRRIYKRIDAQYIYG